MATKAPDAEKVTLTAGAAEKLAVAWGFQPSGASDKAAEAVEAVESPYPLDP